MLRSVDWTATRIGIPTVMKITDELLGRVMIKEIGKGKAGYSITDLRAALACVECFEIRQVRKKTTFFVCISILLWTDAGYDLHKNIEIA